MPSNLTNLRSLPNEVQVSVLVLSGLKSRHLHKFRKLGTTESYFYINDSLDHRLLFLQCNILVFPAIFKLSKRQLFSMSEHAYVKPAAYQILLSNKIVWKHLIFIQNLNKWPYVLCFLLRSPTCAAKVIVQTLVW